MDIPEELVGKTTIDITTAARILGISRRSAYTAAHNGEIPTLTFGHRMVVPVKPLLKMLGLEGEK